MNKEMLKRLCDMNNCAYGFGCLRAGSNGKTIQMTYELFRSMFESWKVNNFDDTYKKWYVVEDGYEFFTLVPKC